MAVINDLTTVAAATAAGYTLRQFTSGANGHKIAIFSKYLTGEAGNTAQQVELGGEDFSNATTARTNALANLNKFRKHRYAGAPGAPDGATVVAGVRGGTLTVDQT